MKNKLQDQRGVALVLELVLIAVVLGAVGLVGYRAYQAKNQPQTTEATQPANSPAFKEQAQTNPNEGYFVVKELGIRLKVSDKIKDLVYVLDKQDPQAASFSTKSLAATSEYCSAERSPIGLIAKDAKPPDGLKEGIKQFGGSYVYYLPPQATCSDSKEVQDLQASQIAELQKAFQTVELAK